MSSVTSVIKNYKQPKGGLINPKDFSVIGIEEVEFLHDRKEENLSPSLIGIVVDYLTRLIHNGDSEKSFRVSLNGASTLGWKHHDRAENLLIDIIGFDEVSIIKACHLANYDSAYRFRGSYKPLEENPNQKTIDNIRIMLERSERFFKKYGPIIDEGFNFKGAYTSNINTGDADFLTKSTLWEFKVLSNAPTSKHTLQLLIYYLMGINSENKTKFKDVSNLGIYNPRLNKIYLLPISKIPHTTQLKKLNETLLVNKRGCFYNTLF
ncbi:hypothetical protein [Shouchella miscanthi]|uniref:hypothetical protein n=1 Tax=Shouchella miscanthi TaxID=2598861 RepID=UPI0011A3A097|nr:hypothetical protein [Shouchella miscanthi]